MTDADPRAVRTIAAGGNPLFERTFTHPEHGELTFRGRLPLAKDSLRHSIELDNLLGELSADFASPQTQITAAAIAGLTPADPVGAPSKGLMLELPLLDEDVKEQPDGSEQIVRRYYDAASEAHLDFLHEVWIAYSAWRAKLLSDKTVRAVGESSGGPSMSSGESSTSSAEATAPPSPTPAS